MNQIDPIKNPTKNMHHGFNNLTSSQSKTTTLNNLLIPSNCNNPHQFYPTTKQLYPVPILHLQTHFLLPACVPSLRCCFGGDKVEFFATNLVPSSRKRRKRCRVGGAHVIASVRETPYQVLGVSPSATPDQIKRAYRKLALKYHPDVNKEPNAQEKFMRIKHAYNTLLNPDSRRRYDSGNPQSDYTYSTAGRNQRTQEEEEFYGLGDFFKDLQEEFQNWEASASSQGKPKSLWEELAEIGEEFVEFLEKELNITEQDSDGEQPSKDSFESSAGRRGINVEESNIKDSIDEIEATLAKLKKELGL